MAVSTGWDGWDVFGEFGADRMPQNRHGGEALRDSLDEVVRDHITNGGIRSPATTARGLSARLNYLQGAGGRQMMQEAGITATDGTIRRWRTGRQRPRPAGCDLIVPAYWRLRTRNVTRNLGWLRQRLDNHGRGIVLEIYPVDQSTVEAKRRRSIQKVDAQRNKKVRASQWPAIIDAYQAGDLGTLKDQWMDIIADLDSDWAA
jgi:hypothetical protein